MTKRKITTAPRPAVGIGYRRIIDEWTRANLARFDVLEITVDHCISGGTHTRAAIFDLVGRIPLTAHGIGLSIGTDEPLDLAYLDQVAEVVERLFRNLHFEGSNRVVIFLGLFFLGLSRYSLKRQA